MSGSLQHSVATLNSWPGFQSAGGLADPAWNTAQREAIMLSRTTGMARGSVIPHDGSC